MVLLFEGQSVECVFKCEVKSQRGRCSWKEKNNNFSDSRCDILTVKSFESHLGIIWALRSQSQDVTQIQTGCGDDSSCMWYQNPSVCVRFSEGFSRSMLKGQHHFYPVFLCSALGTVVYLFVSCWIISMSVLIYVQGCE